MLDYLILDKNGRIISMDFFGCENYTYDGIPSFSLKLMDSMKRGDRSIFKTFCSAEFNPDEPAFELFRLVKFQGYTFMFLEKDLYKGESVTLSFFGKSITDFLPLMSPNTQLYQTATGKSTYEIMLALSNKPAENSYLTPEAFTLLNKAPKLLGELTVKSSKAGVKNCDIPLFTGIIIKHITENSYCGGTSIELTEGINTISTKKIFPLYPAAYVHLFTSLVHILAFMSADKKIKAKLDYHPGGVILELSCFCDTKLDLISDCSSFSDIGRHHRELIYTASVVNTVLNGFDYNPTLIYDKNSGSLSFRLKITEAQMTEVEFKYSDPYSDIGRIVEEAAAFIRFGA